MCVCVHARAKVSLRICNQHQGTASKVQRIPQLRGLLQKDAFGELAPGHGMTASSRERPEDSSSAESCSSLMPPQVTNRETKASGGTKHSQPHLLVPQGLSRFGTGKYINWKEWYFVLDCDGPSIIQLQKAVEDCHPRTHAVAATGTTEEGS